MSRPPRALPRLPRRVLPAVLAAVLLAGGCGLARAEGPGAIPRQAGAAPREVVVLVHGLGRTPLSMLPLARALEREGYRVVNWGYSSTCCTIAELGARLRDQLRQDAGPGAERVHFVGHSLGGIIVRWVLAHEPPVPVGRVVMLAPPNQGSHEADRYARWLGWALKPLPELRTRPDATARSLPLPPGARVGIIAGRDDGKVSVAETHLAGETAHVVVPAAHSFLMFRDDVQRLTAEFLRDGDFDLAR